MSAITVGSAFRLRVSFTQAAATLISLRFGNARNVFPERRTVNPFRRTLLEYSRLYPFRSIIPGGHTPRLKERGLDDRRVAFLGSG